MELKDFFYKLPEELIAQFPLPDRASARLLVLHKKTGKITHTYFYNFPEYIEPGDVLVINNTRVFKARLISKKETGAKIEILLIKETMPGQWSALLSNARKIKKGTKLIIDKDIYATVVEKDGGRYLLRFNEPVEKIIEIYGKVPLPHYIKRDDTKSDKEYYQSVYAKKTGSIAAPTAGLHFTPKILEEIRQKGGEIVEITHHIGPGTFRPIRAKNIEDHNMESEYFEISPSVSKKIKNGRRIIGVGTSVCRAAETFGISGALSGNTELFIYPGFKFKIIQGLLTNFHLPGSTPLLLVCSFAGKRLIFKAYEEAIKLRYRFLSYGDAMLILP